MWAGLVAFLVMLFGCVQLLYGLHAVSTVTAMADDAAQRAAAGDAAPWLVDRELRRQLTAIDPGAVVEWPSPSCAGADRISLHVVVEPPRFLPPGLSRVDPIGVIDRRVDVRCERVR